MRIFSGGYRRVVLVSPRNSIATLSLSIAPMCVVLCVWCVVFMVHFMGGWHGIKHDNGSSSVVPSKTYIAVHTQLLLCIVC